MRKNTTLSHLRTLALSPVSFIGGKRITSTPSSNIINEGSYRENPDVLILNSFASGSSLVRSTYPNFSFFVVYFKLHSAQIGFSFKPQHKKPQFLHIYSCRQSLNRTPPETYFYPCRFSPLHSSCLVLLFYSEPCFYNRKFYV